MYRFIYSLLLYLLMPFILLRLLLRSGKNTDYRHRIPERFGFIPVSEKAIKVWVHAVSVGETLAARPLIEQLLGLYGDNHVLVTTTTPTGSATVARLFGNRVLHHYFPYDLPDVVGRYLKRIAPDVLVCMETEIWPNLWHACHDNGIPVVLANARMSARSARRYQKIQVFVSDVLSNASLIACRNSQDAERFTMIGADSTRVKVIGDIKLDIQLAEKDRRAGEKFRLEWGRERPVLVAASTHAGEDEQILDLYSELKNKIDELLLVIVPRHPERFETVAELIHGRHFALQLRSDSDDFKSTTEVVLGDTMGEMMSWYSAADLVFMGGSMVPTGGHNPMEPLACGKPVISGPHVFNFESAFLELQKNEAAFIANNLDELLVVAQQLLCDSDSRTKAGERGAAIVSEGKGATNRLVDEISQLLK